MAVRTDLKFARVEDLSLDPQNPRLGRSNTRVARSQNEILDLMKDWTLEELAVSFLQSGFWPQEALIVVKEKLNGIDRLVVVEGNRRLAALKFLLEAVNGRPANKRWADLAAGVDEAKVASLELVPYLEADNRRDVEIYLGFRHVTGIKQWEPTEKAEYIAHLIDDLGMTYTTVMRAIGSKTPTVRQHYITYRLLLQMETDDERISVEHVERKFSVLYLSIRSQGVQRYLDINILGEPDVVQKPVPPDKLEHLVNFARWLFGDDKHEPVVTDSRQIDRFGRILESQEAIDYLERSSDPSFETAYRKAGGNRDDVLTLVERASDSVSQALSSAHRYVDYEPLRRAIDRFRLDALQLIQVFEKPLQTEVSES